MPHINKNTDKYNLHNYYDTYSTLATQSKVTKLLEIGVGGYQSNYLGGDSLFAWRDLFPCAELVALDYYDKQKINKPDNCTIYRGSQDDEKVLADLIAHEQSFDLIIDDGSHRNEHVIYSFEHLFPALSENGVYIIEDVQTSYWPNYNGGLNKDDTMMNYFKALTDSINKVEIDIAHQDFVPHRFHKSIKSITFEHNLIIIKKGNNTYPSNFDFDSENPLVQQKIMDTEEYIARHDDNQAAKVSLIMLTLQCKMLEKGMVLIEQYLEHYPVDLNVSLYKISTLMRLGKQEQAKQHAEYALIYYPDDVRLLKQAKPLFDYNEQTFETIAKHTNADINDQFDYFMQLLSRHNLEKFKQRVSTSSVRMNEGIAPYFMLFINAKERLDLSLFQSLDFNHHFTKKVSPFVFRELRNKQQFDTIIELYSMLPGEYHKRPMIHNITAQAYLSLQRYEDVENFIFSHLTTHNNAHLWHVLSQCKERQQQIPLALCYAIHAITFAPQNENFIKRVEHLKKQAPELSEIIESKQM